MTELHIEGGRKLEGTVAVQGAKNSVLPLLAATLLTKEPCVLHNCPRLSDVDISCRILTHLGCRVRREGNTVTVNPCGVMRGDIPESLMRQMRSSIVFLGAIVSRTGGACMSAPGGCELGNRPIDLHLMALRKLGVTVEETGGCLSCKGGRLKGIEIPLGFPSVGATENILLSAVLAKGRTVIRNAAREPEITDLIDFLTKMGAKITGAGESTLYIDGVETLHGCEHRVIPDRIVAATWLGAAAVTKGDITLTDMVPEHLSPILHLLSDMGCNVQVKGNTCRLQAPKRLTAPPLIRTMPYPGFPTDAQAPMMAVATVAEGTGIFIESIFDSRYKHVAELRRLGADIRQDGRTAVVCGVLALAGASVECTDLRGGAALLIGGLAAEGQTKLSRVYHIDRGYDDPEGILTSLGGRVRRVESGQ